jgi:DNA polymerase elongation subunit (family B)
MIQDDVTADVLTDGLSNKFAFIKSSKSIMPTVLDGLMKARDDIKRRIVDAKNTDNTQLLLTLIAEESAIKTLSNGACGARGEQSEGNPISHCHINDLITTTGRSILLMSKRIAEQFGAAVIYGDTDSLFVKCDNIDALLDNIHEHLPDKIRFKVEYLATQFIMGNKKHYIAKIGSTVKIAGFKANKSSSCRAVKNVFNQLVDVCLDNGPEFMISYYNSIVDEYANNDTIPIDDLSVRMSYKGKDYSSGSYLGMVIQHMKSRHVELIPGNYLDVVPVKSEETYIQLYGEMPTIQLPHDGGLKSQYIYTVEELENNARLIDIQEIFDKQCRTVIDKILRCYDMNRRDNMNDAILWMS